MSIRPISTVLALLLLLPVSAATAADIQGDGALSVGASEPEGNFTHYAETGLTGIGRLSIHFPGAGMFSAWTTLTGALFDSESSDVDVFVDGYRTSAERTTTESGFALHGGLQLGSSTRRGFLRPRGAFGIGIWMFNTSLTYTMSGQEEPFIGESDTDWKFGWRANGGLDLFFRTSWGIALDVAYDHVFDMEHRIVVDDNGDSWDLSQPARYLTVTVGAVWPVGRI